jgi:hypothetical protein
MNETTQESPVKAFAPSPKVTSVTLMTVSKPEQAAGLRWALDGQTYMKFRVTVCPYNGMFNVNVETDYEAGQEEIKDFLLYVLAARVAKER